MVRAITEAAQARMIYVAGSRDDFFSHDFAQLKRRDDAQAVESLETLRQAVHGGGERLTTGTFEGDIHVIVERLRRAGLEQVLVVDLSRPDFPEVSVVRVIVPGLEGYMFDHYAPGLRARAFLERLQS
jgi:ribosomal protein S12 methylthiotransferase accessory factor